MRLAEQKTEILPLFLVYYVYCASYCFICSQYKAKCKRKKVILMCITVMEQKVTLTHGGYIQHVL